LSARIDFTGQAIRVRANFSYGELVTPKSGKVRSVPTVPEVAQALARLGQRGLFTADHDPVFCGTVGGHLDASALRRRCAPRGEARRPPAPAVPLAAPLLRVDGREPGVARPGPVVDGPLGDPDDGPLGHRREPAAIMFEIAVVDGVRAPVVVHAMGARDKFLR
jgi:hypothetical protein